MASALLLYLASSAGRTPHHGGETMAVTTLYHGAHTAYTLHEGQCYTRDREVAEWFARRGVVATIEIDLDALVVERCPGYDHDQNYAPADDPEIGRAEADSCVDVLVYDDEYDLGGMTTCYRFVNECALGSVRVVAVEEIAW